jgi:hypothetical protein
MSGDDFRSFEEFWPFYVREHSTKLNRLLHFAGTGGALSALAMAAARRKSSWLLLAPAIGYGAAWIGHFFVERNTPATFKHPLWSLRADLVMFSKMVAGTMDEEVERVLARDDDAEDAPEARPNGRHGANGGSNGEGAYVRVDPTSPTDPHSIN